MELNDFDQAHVHVPRPKARQRRMQQTETPSFAIAMLGVACVIGVFALLGLLYSFG